MEIKRNSLGNNRFRSIDSIILKFPQIRDGLKEIRGVFEKFGELGLQGKIFFFFFWSIMISLQLVFCHSFIFLTQTKIQMELLTTKNWRNACRSYSFMSERKILMIFSITATWMKMKGYNSMSSLFFFVSFISSRIVHPRLAQYTQRYSYFQVIYSFCLKKYIFWLVICRLIYYNQIFTDIEDGIATNWCHL